MRNIRVLIALCVGSCAAVAMADWHLGDPYKMHFPQLPDPFGWDVEIVSPTNPSADDWLCTETGPVSDIHFWTSWAGDQIGVIQWLGVEIHADIPADPGTPDSYSKPGEVLWSYVFDWTEFSMIPYGTGDQGFYDPPPAEAWAAHDHMQYQQLNIESIQDPFVQQAGTTYWLSIWASWEGSQAPVGWKTSQDHFGDVAVYWHYIQQEWYPLYDPIDGEALSLAFVITPEPGGFLLAGAGLLLLARRR